MSSLESLPTWLDLASLSQEAERELARRSLADFACYVDRSYQVDPFHAHLAAALDRVVAGELNRLLVIAPPQTGKSRLSSELFPAFWAGRRPDDPVILTSYAASLAYTFSGRARGIVEGQEFGELFPAVTTDRASRAVDHWRIAGHRGEVRAAGVGGGITGHGARLGVIDDPVENYEQAASEVYRERAWDWYRSTFRSRIWEGGAIVVCMTRWHHDDLAGRILKEQPGEWTVLRYPALAEDAGDPLGRQPGEALAPRRFSAEALAGIRRDVGPWTWEALYQGHPTPRDGALFRVSSLGEVGVVPPGLRSVRAWDTAATAGDGDWTAGVKIAGPDSTGRWYVEHVVRGQWDTSERNAIMRATAVSDGVEVQQFVQQEGGSGGKDAAQYIVRLLAGYRVKAATVTGDKATRAAPLSDQVNAGSVSLVVKRGEGGAIDPASAWVEAFREEMRLFPAGRHDDQVDAAASAFNELARKSRHTQVLF